MSLALKWIKSDRKQNGKWFSQAQNKLCKPSISILHPGLSSATRECDSKQAEVGGNRFFSLKLICCLTEREDWSAACAIRNPTLVQSLICQSFFRSTQRWKAIL